MSSNFVDTLLASSTQSTTIKKRKHLVMCPDKIHELFMEKRVDVLNESILTTSQIFGIQPTSVHVVKSS
ncbi:hypothetical protein AHAS_Ahas17G0031900 [Arachis hypogaea]